ncbi:hypothetical protein ACE6H2_003930 [Prunus campanulata]
MGVSSSRPNRLSYVNIWDPESYSTQYKNGTLTLAVHGLSLNHNWCDPDRLPPWALTLTTLGQAIQEMEEKNIGLPQFPYTGAFDEVPDEFFDELFSQQSQVTQVNVQVGNENVGTVEVPVHSQIAENVVHEEDTEKESSEEEDSEEDTYVEGRRWRIEDSGDESDKEIYETDNDAALDDNDLFDANIQSKFGGIKRRSNVNPPNSFNPPRTSCSKK